MTQLPTGNTLLSDTVRTQTGHGLEEYGSFRGSALRSLATLITTLFLHKFSTC